MKQILLIIIWVMNVSMLHHFLNLSSKLSLFVLIVGVIVLITFRKKILINLLPLFILAGLLGWLSTIQASNDREWHAEVSKLPTIKINNDRVTVNNLRNAIWHDSKLSINWEKRNYDLSNLSSLDLVVEPFNNSKLMAHTMLVFGFGEQGNVVISVEARKEANEAYSLLAGALRQFELIYIFGDEKDLLSLRALKRGSALHMYPIKADPKFIASLFKDLANSANALHTQPRFYRTLRDNCTTTLVRHLDRHYNHKIGIRVETIFPAKAGALLHKLKRMDTKLSYQQAYQASRIEHLVVKHRAEEESFSLLLHTDSDLAYANQ
jgi:hypothetical protein